MVVGTVVVVNNNTEGSSYNLTNGKPVKSKNQLRRLKRKQKKETVRWGQIVKESGVKPE